MAESMVVVGSGNKTLLAKQLGGSGKRGKGREMGQQN